MGVDPDHIFNWLVESVAKPFGIAVFFVFLALLWTFPLQHVIAYPFVFLFFGAIMCSAWFGGYVAGSMAVVLSSVMVTFFFVPPLYSLSIAREFRSYVAAFALCALAIAMVSSSRRRAETAAKAARDQLEIRVQQRTAELQQSNLEITERERQLRLLTEAIPQQIWRTDANGQVQYCNGDLVEYIGVDTNGLRGQVLFRFLHPEDKAHLYQSWEAARNAGAGFEVQARVRGVNGQYRWFLIRSSPQLAANGEVMCWYGVHIDVEDQRRAQRDLLVAQDDLARLSRTLSMSEMAASIAHELNQPLTALVTDAHACRRWLSAHPANTERAIASSERIVREGTRASEVVKRIRSLFGKSDYVRESTDINHLIEDMARLLRDEALRYNVSIKLRLSSEIPRLMVDPVLIQQVIVNLATNGMEAMARTAGTRELEISSENGGPRQVTVTVRDHGEGLEEHIRAKAFDPFFTTKPKGTGMGLAICRSIVEAHDGRIWVEALESGAAFHFSIGVSAE